MRYSMTHTIETDASAFWSLFFDYDFNRNLYGSMSPFTCDVLEQRTDDSGIVHRSMQFRPTVEVPAAVRKFVGDGAFLEVGRFDPRTAKYIAEWKLGFGGDRFQTKFEIWTEPLGDKRCDRHLTIENTVRLFGLGGLIERTIMESQRTAMTQIAEFVNGWIHEHNL